MRGGRIWSLIAFALAALLPAMAWACPYCAGQDDPGYGQQIAVGLMVASPYVVVGTVVFIALKKILKAGHREEQQ